MTDNGLMTNNAFPTTPVEFDKVLATIYAQAARLRARREQSWLRIEHLVRLALHLGWKQTPSQQQIRDTLVEADEGGRPKY